MGRTARPVCSAARFAVAVLLGAVLALVLGAGSTEAVQRAVLDPCTAACAAWSEAPTGPTTPTSPVPNAPSAPNDPDCCPEPAERRRDHGNSPVNSGPHRVGHSRPPALDPFPALLVTTAPPYGCGAGPVTGRPVERAGPERGAGLGVVLRC